MEGQVRRRKVFYLPGYDPIPPRRYREIYRREGAAQARISGYGLDLPAGREGPGFGWRATGRFGEAVVEADIEVLGWGDVVAASMGRSIPATYLQLARTAAAYIGSGALWPMMRLRRGPVLTAFYPVAMLLGQLLAAILGALLAGWTVARLVPGPAGVLLGAALGLGLGAGLLIAFRRLDGRLFVYYLMHDFAFTARSRGAYSPELEARLECFVDRLAAEMEGDWDEVLLVGHSSGAYLAVSAAADLLRARAPAPGGPAFALLTLGQVVPMASFLPRAGRLRADLALLAGSDRLAWVDVSAPGDPCSFGLCDPVAVSGVAPEGQRNPLIVSAAFTRTLSPEKQAELKNRFFRLHFQYLHAFDRPGDYDYFAITAGPLTLAERFAGRPHSPGRITRAVSRHRSVERRAADRATA